MSINLNDIIVIDVHTHAEVSCCQPHDDYRPEFDVAFAKYFPPQLIQYANTQLKDRIFFRMDFPLITPERWMKDFETAGFKEEVKPLILKENAARMLKLDIR